MMLPAVILALATAAAAGQDAPVAAPPGEGAAEAEAAVERACANELGMLCPHARDAGGSARACLMDNYDALLPACRRALRPDPAGAGRRSKRPARDEIVFTQDGYHTENARLFHERALKGEAEAQKNLGAMLQQGLGVQKNEKEGLKWYRKAAENGHGGAQYDLGFIYETGRGASVDLAEAYTWYFAYALSTPSSTAVPFPTFDQFSPTIIKKLRKLEAELPPGAIEGAQARANQIVEQARGRTRPRSAP